MNTIFSFDIRNEFQNFKKLHESIQRNVTAEIAEHEINSASTMSSQKCLPVYEQAIHFETIPLNVASSELMPTVFQAEPLYDDKDINVTEIRTQQPTYSSTTKQTRTNSRPSSMQRNNRMFISVYLAFFVNILVMIMSVIFTFCKQHLTTLLAYVNSSGFILR